MNRRATEPYGRWCERWREQSRRLLDYELPGHDAQQEEGEFSSYKKAASTRGEDG